MFSSVLQLDQRLEEQLDQQLEEQSDQRLEEQLDQQLEEQSDQQLAERLELRLEECLVPNSISIKLLRHRNTVLDMNVSVAPSQW